MRPVLPVAPTAPIIVPRASGSSSVKSPFAETTVNS
jgi:hypothetical protein